MLEHGLIVVASFLAALVFTPMVRAMAIRLGIVDRPDDHRKLHGRVIARAGGTAVLLSMLVVCSIGLLSYDLKSLDLDHWQPYISLFIGMSLIWLLGFADDVWNLRGRQKLAGQIAIAFFLVLTGYQMHSVALFGHIIELGWLGIPLSVGWLIVTTNSLNLIDGSDGLCSTLGAIICGALGTLAALNGHFAEAAIAFSLCGALLGFLVFNFPPASIFLGDSGSLLVGLISGALAIRCSLKGPAAVAFMAPMAIFCLPLLDSAMAIVRRKLTGRSIYATDRAHLHHTLKNKGLSDRGLLVAIACLATIPVAGAILGQELGQDWLGPVGVAFVFVTLVSTKAFGYAEVALIARKGSHFALSIFEPQRASINKSRARAVRLQGTRQWETIWNILVEYAEVEGLAKAHLDLNVPWLEEGFHGTWQRGKASHTDDQWTATLPVYAGAKLVGRLDVAGPATSADSIQSLSKLIDLVGDLDSQVLKLIDSGSLKQESEKRSAPDLSENERADNGRTESLASSGMVKGGV